MVLELALTRMNPYMSSCTVECVFAEPGTALTAGTKLLDVSVDLGDDFSQQCPPISFYRVVIREKAVLRELRVPPGEACGVGDVIAVFSTTPDEPLGPAQRALRIATANIIPHDGMARTKAS